LTGSIKEVDGLYMKLERGSNVRTKC